MSVLIYGERIFMITLLVFIKTNHISLLCSFRNITNISFGRLTKRQSAQARAFRENEDYILPARFDDTEILGLLDTVGFIDLKELSPEKFAQLIVDKIRTSDLLAARSKRSL